MHAIAIEAANRITGQGAAMQLAGKDALALADKLEQLGRRPEIADAARSLIALAAHVELDHGAVACADALLRVALSAAGDIARLAETATGALETAVRQVQSQFSSFSGRLQRRTAPKFAAAVPVGAMRLSTMRIPAVIR